MLNFETDAQEHPRIFPVADPKQEQGFKVVDRRLFTEEGELRKDAAEQDRRWDEDSKKAASSSPSRSPAKAAPSVAQPSAIEGSTDNGQVDAQEAEGQEPSRNFQM